METTARKPRKSSKKGSTSQKTDVQEAYVRHLLTHGARPASVFKFCLDLAITEELFYEQFGSFDAIEKRIWKDFILLTTDRLNADARYHEFSSRERILAFYFTLFEELKKSRSLVLQQLSHRDRLELVPAFLKDFKAEFEKYIEGVLKIGQASGEVAKRPFLDQQYPNVFWMHFGFIMKFWREDDSPAFEKTDAAIEKSVNLAFDLIGKGALDSVIDFAKFLYQAKMK